jgi:hypothetical protein
MNTNGNIAKRGRPRGKAKPIGQRMADLADKTLISWVRDGIPSFTGQLNAQGEPIMWNKPASAAHLRCILTRLSQIQSGVFSEGKGAKSLVDIARERGIGATAAAGGWQGALQRHEDDDEGDDD